MGFVFLNIVLFRFLSSVTDSIYSYFSHFYFMETFDNFYIFCHFHSNKTEMKVLKVTDRAFMLK